MDGWTGRLLNVNLGDATSSVESIPAETLSLYLGGAGLGTRLLYDRLPVGTDPLSPDNPLIFTVGPLTGTKAPTAGRSSVATRSPLSNTVCDASCGGSWGLSLKGCGFDALVVNGASPRPVYLRITPEGCSFHDAAGLWGKNTEETTEALGGAKNGKSRTICIGPGGENLVRFACIRAEASRSFGRGGVGAVMGSKKLKAIVAEGGQRPTVADSSRMDFVVKEATRHLKQSPITSKALTRFGTAVLVNITNRFGIFPTRNYQSGEFEGAAGISGESIAKTILSKRAACHGCSIACSRKTKTSSRSGDGPEYETVWALGADCGIGNLELVAEANYLCNQLGLDTISAGATIACCMEMTEKGIVKDGIRFGDADALAPMVESIALRNGIGDELAEGSLRFATKYGHSEYSMTVKGLEMPAYDPRGLKGMGLSYATSNRGACHLRGGYAAGPEILGVPRRIDRMRTMGKAGDVVKSQDMGAVMDSLVGCRFTNFALSEQTWARLLSACVGHEVSGADLMRTGERIYNLQRLFNVREGFNRKDDTLPTRLLEEPLPSGASAGQILNLEPMLDEYYAFRGWGTDGIPAKAKLDELELS